MRAGSSELCSLVRAGRSSSRRSVTHSLSELSFIKKEHFMKTSISREVDKSFSFLVFCVSFIVHLLYNCSEELDSV